MGTTPALSNTNETIIFFDGVCNLCSGAVKFVLKRDQKHRFKFASLQSDFARERLSEFGLRESLETIVLIQNGVVYKKSDAALNIVRQLDFPWPILYVLKIFPKAVRDFLYEFVATHRYRWFGKSDHCLLPAPELAERFVG
jgi:predicted DCC family thiol-disulfide oxidoreductase YuxK